MCKREKKDGKKDRGIDVESKIKEEKTEREASGRAVER